MTLALVPWAALLALVVVLVIVDLRGHREAESPDDALRSAVRWSVFFVGLGLGIAPVVGLLYELQAFGLGVAVPMHAGPPRAVGFGEATIWYLTGYVLEKALALDNLFVMALVFTSTRVPHAERRSLLLWGVLGAVVLRGVMIGLGGALIREAEWLLSAFGLLLVVSALRILREQSTGAVIDPEAEALASEPRSVQIARRFLPLTGRIEGGAWFLREGGRWVATPLFLALVVIELSDLVMAIDSIPAVLSVTLDPFIVYASNVLALLGLRSLYGVLEASLARFVRLRRSLSWILLFVGSKMVLHVLGIHVPPAVSLAVITTFLGLGLMRPRAPRALPIPVAAAAEPPRQQNAG